MTPRGWEFHSGAVHRGDSGLTNDEHLRRVTSSTPSEEDGFVLGNQHSITMMYPFFWTFLQREH